MRFSLTLLVFGVLVPNCSALHGNDRIITELNEAMKRMEASMERMDARMEARMEEAEIKRKDELHRMEARISDIEIKRNEELHKMEDRMEGFLKSEEMYKITDVIAADNELLKGKTDGIETYLVSTQTGTDVSFSAYAEQGYQYPGEVIRFRRVMTNSGGHYNPEESVFTCPLNGTYYFVFSVNTGDLSDGEFTSAVIQIGEEQLSDVWCRKSGPDYLYTQCGNSVVAHCVKEQQVYITARYYDGQVHGNYKATTFSGFLLHADIPPNY